MNFIAAKILSWQKFIYALLFCQDVLKFGFSTREYVILTEKSQDSDDDEPEPGNEEG